MQRNEDIIGSARGQLEADLAGAETAIQQANDAEFRRDLGGVAEAGVALGQNVLTENSPLREKLGLSRIEYPLEGILSDISAGRTTGTSAPTPSVSTPATLQKNTTPMQTPEARATINRELSQKGINEGSKLGRAYHANPEHMKALEDAFGLDFLKDIFNLGV